MIVEHEGKSWPCRPLVEKTGSAALARGLALLRLHHWVHIAWLMSFWPFEAGIIDFIWRVQQEESYVNTHSHTVHLLQFSCWSPFSLSVLQVEGVGLYFRQQLLQSRHRGAFELAYVGFVRLTDMLCRCVCVCVHIQHKGTERWYCWTAMGISFHHDSECPCAL